jgi:hypothetical protein
MNPIGWVSMATELPVSLCRLVPRVTQHCPGNVGLCAEWAPSKNREVTGRANPTYDADEVIE